MGDLHRHAEVFEHAHGALKTIRPNEDYICLELGNYLTDVSQFRDPWAHMLAKRTVWAEAKGTGALWWLGLIPVIGTIAVEAILDFAVDLDEWIHRLLGRHKPGAKRHGELASYFRSVIEGVTQAVFADDVPKSAFWRSMFLPAVSDLKALPPAELDRIYGIFYTQYFPHEHSDHPPYVLYGEHRSRHRLYRRGPRGLSNYLEEYIDYLAESLAKLEVEWKAARDLPAADPKRHDVLLRLGKVLHGIEDYFFHSNYLELHLWHSLRRGRPSTETEDDYRTWFAANIRSRYLPRDGGVPSSGPGEKWRPSELHQVRAHLRRLRYPSYVPVNTLDRTQSTSSLDHLYTAGFDKKDLFHTLSMALESLESSLVRAEDFRVHLPPDVAADLASKSPERLRDSELVLIRTVFNSDFRARMGRDDDYLEEQITTHKKQLDAGVYERGIDHLKSKGYLNAHAAAAWHRAIATDKAMESFGDMTPGVGGFMIGFLARGQKELEESRKRSRRFDTANDYGPGNIFDTRSDNGATGEHIGTHTLMAKDTDTSIPVHEETRRVARFASMAVATLLAQEVNATATTADGLDWDVILRHYLRFPEGKANMWESQVLEYFRTNKVDPTYDQIPDQVRQPRASGAALNRLTSRRSGTVRADLEKRYIDLEERVDHIGNLFG